jgi:hypothetical protein
MFKLPSNLLVLTLSSLSLATPDTTITYANTAQYNAAISRVSTYVTHLNADSSFISAALVLYTGMPDSVRSSISRVETNILGGGSPTNADVLTTESWYTAMPSDVKNILSSAASQEAKLALPSGNRASETRVSKTVAMAGVGVVGLFGVMLML